MAQRGRKSAAALQIIRNPVELAPRPEPPSDLTDEQAVEWRSIVDRLPSDWFGRETHGLLAQYVRHVVASRRISQMIAAMEEGQEGRDFSLQDYDRALKMQERESRAMASLANRMRISQQATYDRRRVKPTIQKRPWD